MGKTTLWIVVALIAYVLFKDKLTGARPSPAVAPSYFPVPGPSPTGHTYANVPPPPRSTNQWDAISTGITTLGQLGQSAFETWGG